MKIVKKFSSHVFEEKVLEGVWIEELELPQREQQQRVSHGQLFGCLGSGDVEDKIQRLHSRGCFEVVSTQYCSSYDQWKLEVDEVFEVNHVKNVEESQTRDEREQRKLLPRLSSRPNQPDEHDCKPSHYDSFANERNSVGLGVLELDQQLEQRVDSREIWENLEGILLRS